MKFLGRDQLNVKDEIKDAYTIRSKFVHGDCIGSKDEEKLKKYGGTRCFYQRTIGNSKDCTCRINYYGYVQVRFHTDSR